MGRTSALLIALAIWLAFYFGYPGELWDVSKWWDIVFVGFVLMPSVLAVPYFALPYRTWRGIGLVGAALVVLGVVLYFAHLHTLADFAKLGGMTAVGFWFLSYFETVAWVVIVALIVPWVDAYSVWRGPTKAIVNHHAQTFTLLSFSFPAPDRFYGAGLGMPDLLFFAVYLGAAHRFGLRVRLTWLCLVLSLGLTIVLGVAFGLNGLPALPFLSFGFFVANGDLLWREMRRGRSALSPG